MRKPILIFIIWTAVLLFLAMEIHNISRDLTGRDEARLRQQAMYLQEFTDSLNGVRPANVGDQAQRLLQLRDDIEEYSRTNSTP